MMIPTITPQAMSTEELYSCRTALVKRLKEVEAQLGPLPVLRLPRTELDRWAEERTKLKRELAQITVDLSVIKGHLRQRNLAQETERAAAMKYVAVVAHAVVTNGTPVGALRAAVRRLVMTGWEPSPLLTEELPAPGNERA